jgi:putative hydrolase of the HAD superfamily
MTTALIFDLDNCLAAANEPGEQVFAPAFNAIRQANQGTLSEETLNQALADCWRHPLDWVATHYQFSEAMRTAAWSEFSTLQIRQPMYGYGDLTCLTELPMLRFLVTSGFRRLQASKIEALQLKPLFTAIHIDAIDEPNRLGKQGLFELIMREYHLQSDAVFVIGDNADSEIAAGNRLGLKTIQTLRPGVPYADSADFHIESLTELKNLIDKNTVTSS